MRVVFVQARWCRLGARGALLRILASRARFPTPDALSPMPYLWHFAHTNVAVLPVLIFSMVVPHSGHGCPSR